MKKKKHPEHENLERWLVSYADFITLLFAFFTVLYAVSQQDKAKYQKAVENIQRSFLSAGGVFPLKGAPFIPFDKPPGKGSQVPPAENEIGPNSKSGDQSSYDRVKEQMRGLFERTTGLGLDPADIDILKSDQGYKIRLGEIIFFKPGSDKIRRESVPFLYELGKRLSRLGVNIQIEGHSDDKASNVKVSNWELSISRAFHIVKFLLDGVEFPAQHLSLAGYGDTRPIATNETLEGRAKNRRVEISIITPDREVLELPW